MWFFLTALPALFAPWRHWLDSVYRELERPTQTDSSSFTYVAGWIFGVPLVLALLACALVYTFYPSVSAGFRMEASSSAVLAVAALICVAIDWTIPRFAKHSDLVR